MGKRKSRKAPPPKKVRNVPTAFKFNCPFCGHTGSVECSIDLKHGVAVAECAVCKEVYATVAQALTEPIDVYSEWIDECEKANDGIDGDDR